MVDHLEEWSRLWKMHKIISPSFDGVARHLDDISTTFWDDAVRFYELCRAHGRRHVWIRVHARALDHMPRLPLSPLQTCPLSMWPCFKALTSGQPLSHSLGLYDLLLIVLGLPKFVSVHCQPNSAAPPRRFPTFVTNLSSDFTPSICVLEVTSPGMGAPVQARSFSHCLARFALMRHYKLCYFR